MARNLFIFALLLALGINAITGAASACTQAPAEQMMNMTASVMSTHSQDDTPHAAMAGYSGECDKCPHSSCHMGQTTSCSHCAAHCATVFLPASMTPLAGVQHTVFKADVLLQYPPSVYSRLLRPPRFS